MTAAKYKVGDKFRSTSQTVYTVEVIEPMYRVAYLTPSGSKGHTQFVEKSLASLAQIEPWFETGVTYEDDEHDKILVNSTWEDGEFRYAAGHYITGRCKGVSWNTRADSDVDRAYNSFENYTRVPGEQ